MSTIPQQFSPSLPAGPSGVGRTRLTGKTTASSSDGTWSSADEGVATVDATGVVTGVAVGEAIITATIDFDPDSSGNATNTHVRKTRTAAIA